MHWPTPSGTTGGGGVPPSVHMLPGPLLPTHGVVGGTGEGVDDGGGTDFFLLGPGHLTGNDLGLGDDDDIKEDFCLLVTGPGVGTGFSGWPGAPGIASLLFFIGDPSKPSSQLCRDFCPNGMAPGHSQMFLTPSPNPHISALVLVQFLSLTCCFSR